MIYVVEDDSSIRELIVYTLNSMNLKTVGFEKPSDFWDQLDSEIPTLVMLDIMLPEENGIDINNVVVHAPYIINLANTIKEETYEIAVRFLKQEIERCKAIGITRLVLHPGSHVKAGSQVGLNRIIEGLNEATKDCGNVKIALETMAGKGSECGRYLMKLNILLIMLIIMNV